MSASINAPILFGRHSDGTPAQAEVRQRCVLTIGERGSGKSVFLQNVNAGLLCCPDVLVWHIELGSGARMSGPWLRPWVDGRLPRPVIDWVAPTEDEALLMTELALQVIEQRGSAYQDLMYARDTDLLPLSSSLPGIYILLDEGKEAVGLSAGKSRLQSNITRIIELGRCAGVNVAMSVLGSTAVALPTETKRQMGVRASFRVTDAEELAHLFGWKGLKVSLEDMPHPGCGLWRDGGAGPVRPFRTFGLTAPSKLERVAHYCANLRPTLDQVSQAVPLGRHYADRWDRTLPLLVPSRGGTGGTPAGTKVGRPHDVPMGHGTGSPAVPPRPGTTTQVIDWGPVDASMAKLRRVARDAQLRRMPREHVEQVWGAMEAELEDDLAAGRFDEPEPKADTDVDPRRSRMLELLADVGPAGLSGPRLLELLAADGLEVPQSTLYRWLKTDAADGGYGRYVHPDHHTGG